MTPTDQTRLDAQLQHLHLHYIQSHYQALATKAAEQQRSHLDYLEQLVEGEATMRETRRGRRTWHARMLHVREPGGLRVGRRPYRADGPRREGEEP